MNNLAGKVVSISLALIFGSCLVIQAQEDQKKSRENFHGDFTYDKISFDERKVIP